MKNKGISEKPLDPETVSQLKLLMKEEYDLYHFIKQRFYSTVRAVQKGPLQFNTFTAVPMYNITDSDLMRRTRLSLLLENLGNDRRKCEICWHELENI